MNIFGLSKSELKQLLSFEGFARALRNPRFWKGWYGTATWATITSTLCLIKNSIIETGLIDSGNGNFVCGLIVGLFSYWFAMQQK